MSIDNNDNFNKYVGETIRVVRKSMQISQQTLASKLGITPQQVHKYETGVDNIKIEMLWKIANVFGCAIEVFLPKKEKENKNILQVAENRKKLPIKHKSKNEEAIVLLKKFFKLSKEDRSKLLEFANSLKG